MKYTKLNEQYSIDENDGSGPFPKGTENIAIRYDGNTGKPVSAVITLSKPFYDKEQQRMTKFKDETNPSKLEKIANFFNQK